MEYVETRRQKILGWMLTVLLSSLYVGVIWYTMYLALAPRRQLILRQQLFHVEQGDRNARPTR